MSTEQMGQYLFNQCFEKKNVFFRERGVGMHPGGSRPNPQSQHQCNKHAARQQHPGECVLTSPRMPSDGKTSASSTESLK